MVINQICTILSNHREHIQVVFEKQTPVDTEEERKQYSIDMSV